MRPDFARCAADFLNHSTDIYAQYVYNGSVPIKIASSTPILITLEGCKKLCGDGTQYYAW